MNGTIKVGIAEDQAMFRAGIIEVLNSHENIKVVLDACDGRELINRIRGNVPDLLLLDYKMPELNGSETAQILSKKYPDLKILMLSNYPDEEFILSSLTSGAVGYITKDEDAEEIFKAIESTFSTGYYMNDRTSKHLIKNLMRNGKIKPTFQHSQEELNSNERRVIELMSKEYTSKEIAAFMHKGVRTIDGYKADIMQKTGSKNACGIIMYGVKKGIIET